MKNINNEIRKVEKKLQELSNPETNFLTIVIDGTEYNKDVIGKIFEERLKTLKEVRDLIEKIFSRKIIGITESSEESLIIFQKALRNEILGKNNDN